MLLRNLCLICGYENKKDAVECYQCGAPLRESNPTPLVPPLLDEKTIEEAKGLLLKRPVSGRVTLFVGSTRQPILINNKGRIILGRIKSPEDELKIDLNEYEAHSLGVSRQHAALTLQDETCTLEDLGSTNGTWINDVQLEANRPYPLRNGDSIRLGRLLIIVSINPYNQSQQTS